MRQIKRLGALLLTLVMMAACLPAAFAETETTATPEATEGDYTYTITDNKATITKYNGEGGDVVVPDTLGGAPVTVIGEWSFPSSNGAPTSVTLPDSVTAIGTGAFQGNEVLTAIDFGKGLETIGERAFYQCPALTSVTFPDTMTAIDTGAFQECTALTTVTFGKGAASIGEVAFAECTALTTVDLGNGVENIGFVAFRSCHSLTTVSQSDGLKSIGDAAFAFCANLQVITFPAGLTEIGADLFYECPALIHCYTDSPAHKYAVANELSFVLLDATKTYTITFNKGSGSGSRKPVTKDMGTSVTITKSVAKSFSLKGYDFAFFLGSDGVRYYIGNNFKPTGDLTLTAKYSIVSVKKAPTPKLTKESGKIRIRFNKVSGATGYQFVVSTSKNFAAGTGGSKTSAGYKKTYIQSCAGKKLASGKTYYVKVRAYKLDSTGKKVWGKYSSVSSIKF